MEQNRMSTLETVKSIIKKGIVLEHEPMDRHTTFRCGGPADLFILPADEQEAADVIGFHRREGLPFHIIGNGSNLLVSDEGLRSSVICLGRGEGSSLQELSILRQNEEEVILQAGSACLLSQIGKQAEKWCAGGFEALSGIPGCLGGGCMMNAGAYGSELKDVLLSVRVLDPEGQILDVPAESLSFGYRHTGLMDLGLIVLGAVIRLFPRDEAEVRSGNEEYARRRREKQPLEFPSAGSAFKRPEGHFAGRLIEDAGLKGFRIGGAMVSEKHAGFIISDGHASAMDVYRLIRYVQNRVQEETGILLEPEIRLMGEFPEEV